MPIGISAARKAPFASVVVLRTKPCAFERISTDAPATGAPLEATEPVSVPDEMSCATATEGAASMVAETAVSAMSAVPPIIVDCSRRWRMVLIFKINPP
ncbi:hypothetical protein D3C87_1893860 [compost metagenome]